MHAHIDMSICAREVSMRTIMSLIIFCVVVIPTVVTAADESSASLRKTKGDVAIERAGNILKAEEGTPVYSNDTVKTGADGSVGILFKDNSRISLGPNSRLELKKFVFKPAAGQFSMANKLTKGTASIVSGKMSKLSPESVVLETPTSTIGTRGTTVNIKINE